MTKSHENRVTSTRRSRSRGLPAHVLWCASRFACRLSASKKGDGAHRPKKRKATRMTLLTTDRGEGQVVFGSPLVVIVGGHRRSITSKSITQAHPHQRTAQIHRSSAHTRFLAGKWSSRIWACWSSTRSKSSASTKKRSSRCVARCCSVQVCHILLWCRVKVCHTFGGLYCAWVCVCVCRIEK